MANLSLNHMMLASQEKIPCSVGILTFNSGRTLKRALDSVKDFAEIIICDGGSTDETLSIAKEFGCKIIFQSSEFKNFDNTIKDFSGVRNQCLTVATLDWFLYIDSDEAVSSGLAAEIQEIIANQKNYFLVYQVPSRLVIDGRLIKHSSSYPGYQHRFFNKKSGAIFVKSIHERIDFDKKQILVGTLKSPWLIIWDKEEIKEYFAHSEKSIQMEVVRNREQNLYQFLLWAVVNNLLTAAKLFLKAIKNYLFYGFSKSMPVRIELARINYHFKLLTALTKDRFKIKKRSIMKLIYLANARIPTEKAHGIQIMQMCQSFALAKIGGEIEVELVVPRRRNKIKEDPFDYYKVKQIFKIIRLPCLDLLFLEKYLGRIVLPIQSFTFYLSSFFYLIGKQFDLIYTRDEGAIFFLPWKNKMIWEAHNLTMNFKFLKRFIKKVCYVVSITSTLKQRLVENGMNENKIIVAPDGVDLEKFDINVSKEEARAKLGLPQNRKIVLYAGHLYEWKGVRILVEASKYLPSNVEIVLVGGTKEDVTNFQFQINFQNIKLVGHRLHSEIPYWLKAADVLVLPNSAKEQISSEYTSPLKLFEYMSAGRPIVASRLPSLEEVLQDRESAILFTPDDPQDLAEKIRVAIADTVLSEKTSQFALAKVSEFSWNKRARKILSFCIDFLA